ncbi:MAG: type II secretion system protein GspD, partial [Phycisphaerae bacterium]
MIMCQDNQEASMNIGQRVPIPSASGQTTGGTVQTSVSYEEVGIQLEVEPHINPDGWVYMRIRPEVSSIADSTIQIGPGVFAPIFNTRNAETWVAVKDGETVIIGGLITTSETDSESKVPLLGDLPGLGALFRTTVRAKSKTELLIALTPRIVRTVEDGRRLSIEERDKSGIITPQMKQSPYFGNIRVEPETADEIPSIEEPPPDWTPRGGEYDVEPAKQPAPKEKKRYGPKSPRYGPIMPAGEEVVARRPAIRKQPFAADRPAPRRAEHR